MWLLTDDKYSLSRTDLNSKISLFAKQCLIIAIGRLSSKMSNRPIRKIRAIQSFRKHSDIGSKWCYFRGLGTVFIAKFFFEIFKMLAALSTDYESCIPHLSHKQNFAKTGSHGRKLGSME